MTMEFWNLFKRRENKQPEEYFAVTITDAFIKVQHPKRKTEQVFWDDIRLVKLINNDQGPWSIDIIMVMIGENGGCVIPHGAKGFDEVFDRISKYEGFDFANFGKSMTCTDNAEFIVWVKKKSGA
jgi:hypothetical protein